MLQKHLNNKIRIWRRMDKAGHVNKRLLVSFLLICATPVLLFGLFSISMLQSSIHDEISDKILILADSLEAEVYMYITHLEARAMDFSSDGFIRDVTKKIIQENSDTDVEDLAYHLITNKKSLDKTISSIYILDLNGRVIASTDRSEIGRMDSLEEYFLSGMSGVNTIEFIASDDDNLHNYFIVSAPLTEKNTHEIIGVIALSFDTEMLLDILTGKFQLEKGAATSLLGRKETLDIYLVNKNRNRITQSLNQNGVYFNTLPVEKCLRSNQEIVDVYKNYNDEEVIGASMCFPDKKWVLITEITTKEAYSQVRRVTFIFYAVTIAILIIIFILSLISNKRLKDE